MLRYHQLTVEEVLDINKPIHTVNKVEILENWTITLLLRNTASLLRNTTLSLKI
jgi:hypothetical protein